MSFRISTLEPGLNASDPNNWVLRQVVTTREELAPLLRTWRDAGLRVRYRDLDQDAAVRAMPHPDELRDPADTPRPRKSTRRKKKAQ